MALTGLRWLHVTVVVAAVGFVAGLLLLDGTSLEAFDGVVLAALPMTAGAVCLRAASHQQDARLAWCLLGLSCASWGAGGAVWTWLEVVRGEFPFPSAADVGYLAAVPLAVAAMLAFPAAPTQTAGRVRVVLDGVIVTTSLLFCSWALVLGPVYQASSGTLLERAITLAYPFGDLVITVIVVLVLTRSAPDQRTPLALIGIGLLAAAVADSGFAVLIANGTYATGNLIDVGWVLGYLLIASAAARSTTPHTSEVAAVSATPREPLWHTVLPYVPVGGVIAVAIDRRLNGHDLDPVLFWIAMLLMVALGARQIAVLVANRILVTQLQDREVQLAHQALHDPLTGLANRALFDDRVTHVLERRSRTAAAVLFYDVDDFKIVNDSLGHHAGDMLLQTVARRMHDAARAGDTVARLGGDEFAVLLEDVTDHRDAAVVAQRILDLADRPYALDGHTVTVTGSIGIAVTDADADAEAVLRNADIAMYAAKAQGKGRYAVFEPQMRTRTLQRFNASHVQRPAPSTPSVRPATS